VQTAVKTWCVCGEMRGQRGFLTPTFQGVKNAPRFSTLFLMLRAAIDTNRPA
jgi:hypothetical protein